MPFQLDEAPALTGSETWIRHPDLLSGIPLSCIDGRARSGVVGSPGGSLGELVAVLTALEQDRAVRGVGPLDAREVAQIVDQVRGHFAPLYHHTDSDALDQLARALARGGQEPTAEGVERCLRAPPPHRREELLDLLSRPEHTGCGHLAGMMRDAERYATRAGLVQACVRAYFEALWGDGQGLAFEVLEGVHEEGAVVVVHSCGNDRAWGRVPELVPAEGASTFVFHTDAARWFRRQLVRLLVDQGWARDAAALEQSADAAASQQLDVTIQRLANGLPIHVLEPPCSTR